MIFNTHTDLEGLHAPFGASRSSWLRYDDEKIETTYLNMRASERGTILHNWAKTTIDLGIKQPRSEQTLYRYVNDAIGFCMSTEVVLFYSKHFFGTADAISYNQRKKVLRIHDLKTGVTPAHMDQLEIYAALFCLEYKINPKDITIVLRIYQNNEVLEWEPESEAIFLIMDRIVDIENILKKIDSSEGL